MSRQPPIRVTGRVPLPNQLLLKPEKLKRKRPGPSSFPGIEVRIFQKNL